MNSTIVILLLIAAFAILIIGASVRRGPAVTEIDRTIRKEQDDSDA